MMSAGKRVAYGRHGKTCNGKRVSDDKRGKSCDLKASVRLAISSGDFSTFVSGALEPEKGSERLKKSRQSRENFQHTTNAGKLV